MQVTCIMYTVDMDEVRRILKEAGVRVTAGRVALLSHIRRKARAQSAADMQEELRGDLVTIYRTLSVFVSAGLVREVRLAGNSVLYEDANLSHHHHAICARCGKVAELPVCPTTHAAEPMRVPGFARITGHMLEYTGVCTACA